MTRNVYAFLDKPVAKGQYFCLQIVGIDQGMREAEISLGLGCTSCDPATLDARIDLPDDADDLLDRPEYWVVYKNVFAKAGRSGSSSNYNHSHHQVSLADELCFRLDDKSGNVHFYINSALVAECLFSVDITQRLWFFFFLNGKINAIRLIPSCCSSNSSGEGQLPVDSVRFTHEPPSPSRRSNRPNSALIDYYKSQMVVHVAAATAASTATDARMISTAVNGAKTNYNQEECKVCWNAPIECVLYSCGHMCLCWNW
jgi:protein neuralized